MLIAKLISFAHFVPLTMSLYAIMKISRTPYRSKMDVCQVHGDAKAFKSYFKDQKEHENAYLGTLHVLCKTFTKVRMC